MKSSFDNILNSLKEYFSNLTKQEKRRFAFLAVSIIALSIVAVVLLSRTTYVTVYSNLSAAEAGTRRTAIEEMGIDVKTDGAGNLMVPEDSYDTVVQNLAMQGFDSTSLTYDLFAMGTGFGTTDMERQEYKKYQAQEHLRTSINMSDKIADSVVLINLPTQSQFAISREAEKGSVSITLQLKDSVSFSNTEALAVAEKAMGFLPGLERENIRIVDTKLNIYDISNSGEYYGETVSERMQLEANMSKRFEDQVKKVLTPVFGLDNLQVAANVKLNMDAETVSSVVFEPPVEGSEEGIALSMSRLYESTRTGTAAEGVPGTDSNGVNTVEYPYLGLADDESYHKYVEEINYELNEIQTVIEKARGNISELSISVLLNSDSVESDYSEEVRNLVASAIGVNTTLVSVERLPFQVENTAQDSIDAMQGYERTRAISDIVKTAINSLVVVLLVVALFSLIKTLYNGARNQQVAMAGASVIGSTLNYVAGDDDNMYSSGQADEYGSPLERESKSENVAQLEDFIDRDPEAVAMLLRNWLSED